MCEDNIEIGVTEITNNILVSATPTDQIIDINVTETTENVELTITPSVVEVNIDVTQELITEVVTVDTNTCVNIVDVTVTDATDNVVLNVTPSLVEVNINRGENNLSIAEYDTFADLPTIGDTDTYYITLDENKFWRWDSVNEVYVEISSADDRIPYLGAIQNADLGEWGIKSNWFGLDTTPTNPPTAAGTITWNDTDGTADLILKGGNVTLQLGQENVIRVVNKTGATLNEADFRVVRVRSVAEGGAQGQRLAVLLAQGSNDANSATTIGIVTETIADNAEGFITTFGNVSKINTTGAKSYGGLETWVDGDMLYVSPTHAGYLTNVKPVAPQHMVVVGYVVYAHANHGKIFVKVDNGYELDELHNVLISSVANKDTLVYNSATSVWENKPLSGLLTASSPLSIASNVISISQANATTNGYLTSSDWNYFSAKQQALSGTGFVKASGSTISYDNTTYTPTSRTLTINGTTYDLSADRSWTVSVGSGMRNVSSFIATAGQTTFTIVGGYTVGLVDVYVNGTRLNASDYTATNGTTVVLASGLVANDIVDIINYVASLTSGITGSGTVNYLPKWSGSANLTNSQLYDNGTYIGIGTITPRAALDIANGYAYAGGFWTVNESLGGGFYFGDLDTGSSYAFIGGVGNVGASSYLNFYTNATERLRIIANGNVGIGLTNPSYKLDVSGDINITGIYRVNGVAIGSGTGTVTSVAASVPTGFSISGSPITSSGTLAITFAAGYSLPTNASQTNWDTAYTNRITSASSPLSISSNAISISQATTSTSGYLSSTDWNTFNNKQAALTNPVTGTGTSGYLTKWTGTSSINGSVIYQNGSNIGIGTVTASEKLEIYSGATSAAFINLVGNGNTAGTSNVVIGQNSDDGAYFWNRKASFISLGTSNAEKMRITSGGSVGIGVSSPNGMLHVNGRIYGVTTSTYTDFNSGGLISYGAGSTTKYIQMGYDTSGSYGWIQPLTTGVAYNNLILNGAAGNVFIGKTSGNSKFGVSGLPTSSAGLTSGDFYQVSGVVMVVP